MSAERESNHTEHLKHNAEIQTAGAEAIEHMRRHAEKAAETDPADRRAEAAREVINKHEHERAPEPAAVATETETPAPAPTSLIFHPKLNYTQTLASIQRRLTPASRTFSQLIHTPAIEKASEAIENTVARPSVTAGATWTALIIGSIFYFTARRYGYALSGSEIELSFIVGAAVGLGLEWLWRTFIRRPHH